MFIVFINMEIKLRDIYVNSRLGEEPASVPGEFVLNTQWIRFCNDLRGHCFRVGHHTNLTDCASSASVDTETPGISKSVMVSVSVM